MNAETILTSLNRIAELYAPGVIDTPEYKKLAQELREEIAMAEQKRAGRGNRYKAALRFSKFVNKEHGNTRPGYAGAYVLDGKQYIIHGHLGVRFEEPMDGLVEAEEGNRFTSFDKMIEPRAKDVELPDLAELKAKKKIDKAEGNLDKDGRSLVEIGGAWYNTDYIIQMMEMVEPEEAYLVSDSMYAPIVMVGDGAQGVVCPVRRTEVA